jgi:hypothetical protein
MTWLGLLCICQFADATRQRVEPKLVKFNISEGAIGLEMESEHQTRSSPLVSGNNTNERLLISPFVEFRAKGFFYHPNFFELDVSGWQSLSRYETSLTQLSSPGPIKEKSSSNPFLLRYKLSANILKQKPYQIRIDASRNEGTRQLDFYTTTRINTESYGIQAGYRTGIAPMEFSYRHFSEAERGQKQPSSRRESLFKFKATHDRGKNNKSVLNYSYNKWDRLYYSVRRETGTTQLATLANTKRFSEREHINLFTNIRYSRTTSQFRTHEDFQGRASLSVEHSETLRSNTLINIGRRSSGESKGYSKSLNTGLSHQLFDSLTSSLNIFGNRQKNMSSAGSNELTRYGFQWSENYRKRIGKEADLRLSYSLRIQPQERSFAGEGISVLDERHTLSDDKVVLLNTPGVILSSVTITDADGSVLYTLGFDYLLINQGALTEIRRVTGGNIQDGQEIRADYRAATQPSGEVTGTTHATSWRLNFWGDNLSMFGRYSTHDIKGDDWILIDEYRSLLIGLESRLDWLNVGMEFENHESTLTPYKAIRFKQSANWQSIFGSTLSLNFRQMRRTFPEANRRIDYFDYTGRVQFAPIRNLNCSLEAGYRIEEGDGIDRSMVTSRITVKYGIGKLVIDAEYRFQSRSFYGDQLGRHYVQLSAKRTF